MKNNGKSIYLSSFIVFMFIGLLVLYLLYLPYKKNILAIYPNDSSTTYPVRSLDEINEKSEMFTYLSISKTNVKALQTSFSANLKKTNYLYPYVLGYPLTQGGFFSKEEQRYNKNVIVLNEKASFEFFGGNCINEKVIIGNEPYLVYGVIKDGDDSINIYISSKSTDLASIIFSLLDDKNGISEEFISTQLKSIAPKNDVNQYMNFEIIQKLMTNHMIFALGINFCTILIIYLIFSINKTVVLYQKMKVDLQQYYPSEMWQKNKAACLRQLGYIILMITLILTIGATFFHMFGIILFCIKHNSIFMNTAPVHSLLNFLNIQLIYFTSQIFIVFIFISSAFQLLLIKSKSSIQ